MHTKNLDRCRRFERRSTRCSSAHNRASWFVCMHRDSWYVYCVLFVSTTGLYNSNSSLLTDCCMHTSSIPVFNWYLIWYTVPTSRQPTETSFVGPSFPPAQPKSRLQNNLASRMEFPKCKLDFNRSQSQCPLGTPGPRPRGIRGVLERGFRPVLRLWALHIVVLFGDLQEDTIA